MSLWLAPCRQRWVWRWPERHCSVRLTGCCATQSLWPDCSCPREHWALRFRSRDPFPRSREEADLQASSLCLKAAEPLCVYFLVWFRQDKLLGLHCWAGLLGSPQTSSSSVLQRRAEDSREHRVMKIFLSFLWPWEELHEFLPWFSQPTLSIFLTELRYWLLHWGQWKRIPTFLETKVWPSYVDMLNPYRAVCFTIDCILVFWERKTSVYLACWDWFKQVYDNG